MYLILNYTANFHELEATLRILFFFAGRNCELCNDFFYRHIDADLSALDVCKPCECYSAGTKNGSRFCNKVSGFVLKLPLNWLPLALIPMIKIGKKNEEGFTKFLEISFTILDFNISVLPNS